MPHARSPGKQARPTLYKWDRRTPGISLRRIAPPYTAASAGVRRPARTEVFCFFAIRWSPPFDELKQWKHFSIAGARLSIASSLVTIKQNIGIFSPGIPAIYRT